MAESKLKAKYESSYDSYFPEETAHYYSLMLEYAKLTDENTKDALWIAQKALVLADRYNTISNDATKLDSIKTGIKSDKQKFFYGRYRILREIHNHARMMWRDANEGARNYGGGVAV
jgi:hypothetical protein